MPRKSLLRDHTLLMVPVGNNFGVINSVNMSRTLHNNEWNLLKDQFDALVPNEGVRREDLEQVLDYEIRRRFGEVIASAAGDQTKRIYGALVKSDYAAWPPEPGRAKL
jgi:hypothetical protein